MPLKLDWADRRLFVATREGQRYAEPYRKRAVIYTRALAELAARPRKPKGTTTLDGVTVTKRRIESLLTKLEKKPPQKGYWFPKFDYAEYARLKSKYKSALERCDAPETVKLYGAYRTEPQIQSYLGELYKDVTKKSRFSNAGPSLRAADLRPNRSLCSIARRM